MRMVSMFVKYCGIRLYVGLSTDEKPTNATNASRFFEMDTKDTYVFDKDNSEWIKQGENPEPVGGDEVFYIDISMDLQTEKIVANKTYSEIEAAYENNQFIICRWPSDDGASFYYLDEVYTDDVGDYFSFVKYNILEDVGVERYVIMIYNNNTV